MKKYNSTVQVYPTLFVGEGAYGSAELQKLRTYVKGFGSAGTEDPIDQRMTIGAKTAFAAKILQQEAIVVFESA